MHILVIGADGQIARSLKETAAEWPQFEVSYIARPDIDLTRPDAIAPIVRSIAPDVVINPAAYTAVDRAEAEPDLAFAINRDGAAAVAAAANEVGAVMIHYSTDYVFDGGKAEPYVETDPTSPQSVYGRSKLEGELAVAAANPRCVILRTAWVYAPFGSNFVRTMLRLAAERDRLRVVDDQLGCPSYAPDLAAATLALASRLQRTGWRDDYAGVTHLAGPAAMSWRAFAQAVMEASARRGGPTAEVEPITTAEYPTAAKRPANSRLATTRLAEVFAVQPQPFEISLGRCLDRLLDPA